MRNPLQYRTKRSAIPLAALLMITSVCFAQKFEWVKPHVEYDTQIEQPFETLGIAVDSYNNSYTLILFKQTISIDGQVFSAPDNRDILVLKYDSLGTLQWGVPFGSPLNDGALDIKIINNNVLVLYTTGLEATTFPDTTVQAMSDMQIAELDGAGNFLKIIQMGQYCSFGLHIFDVFDGNIFYASCDGNFNTTIRKIDPLGVDDTLITIYALSQASSTASVTNLRCAANGDLLVAGLFHGIINAGSASLTYYLSGDYFSNFYLRIDSSGNTKWAERSGTGSVFSAAMGSDEEGNTYIGTGTSSGSLYQFGDVDYNPASENESFLAKLDTAGILVWYKAWYSENEGSSFRSCEIDDIYINSQSNIFALGRYVGINIVPYAISLTEPNDDYVLKFDEDGNNLWVATFNSGELSRINYFASENGNQLFITSLLASDSSTFGCLSADTFYGGFYIASLKDTAATAPQISFDSEHDNQIVYFESSADGATGVEWDFGDGQTSTQVNPVHTYAATGYFNTCLTASYNCGSSQHCESVSIPGVAYLSPSYSNNSGWVFADLYGVGFAEGTTIKLTKAGFADIFPASITIVDSSHIGLAFRFSGEQTGKRDVSVDVPGLGAFVLADGFEIQATHQFDPWVQISVPQKILVGSSNHATIAVGNNGNETAYGVVVLLTFSGSAEVTLLNTFIPDSLSESLLDSINPSHLVLVHDSLSNDSTWIGAFVIPMLKPGDVFYFNPLIRSTTAFSHINITANVLPSALYDSTLFDGQISFGIQGMNPPDPLLCEQIPSCLKCVIDLVSMIPAVSCVASVYDVGCAILDYVQVFDTPYLDATLDLGETFLSAGVTCLVPEEALFREVFETIEELKSGFDDAIELGTDCGECFHHHDDTDDDDDDSDGTDVIFSADPNIKEGLNGYGSRHFIDSNSVLFYNISFENADSATSPANQVVITDHLDSIHADLSTFQFSGFGIGDSVFEIGIEKKSFARDYDLRPAHNCILRALFDFNETTGLITWKFISLDPVTYGPLPDPLNGFLPPNVNAPEGQASVSYHINPKPGLPHETVISNSASIVFDFNAAIETPEWINTIDAEKPTSNILPLPPAINSSGFTVHWSGIDADAGIRDFRIYVSDNDSAYFLWQFNVKTDSAIFTGQANHKYEFYSIARDNVGNVEDAPSDPGNNPDATTIVSTECTCSVPADLVITDITSSKATVTWEPNSCAIAYSVHRRRAGTSEWGVPSMVPAISNSKKFKNLAPGITYEVQVQSLCASGDSSGYSESAFFTTGDICHRPKLLSSTNVTSSSADLSWSFTVPPTKWVIYYYPSNEVTAKKYIDGSSSNFHLTGLAANTAYYWYMKAKCGSEESNATPVQSFITTSLRDDWTQQRDASEVYVYPNPSASLFTITFTNRTGGRVIFKLVDVLGRTTLQQEMNVDKGVVNTNLDVSAVAMGVYQLQVITPDGTMYNKAVVKVKE